VHTPRDEVWSGKNVLELSDSLYSFSQLTSSRSLEELSESGVRWLM
jgi:hypothetical protein